jgi:hypothetical protein
VPSGDGAILAFRSSRFESHLRQRGIFGGAARDLPSTSHTGRETCSFATNCSWHAAWNDRVRVYFAAATRRIATVFDGNCSIVLAAAIDSAAGRMGVMSNEIWRAGYWEWEASLFGALLVAIAAGALAATVFAPIAAAMILVGVPLHAWGMFRVYRRNPGPPIPFPRRHHV